MTTVGKTIGQSVYLHVDALGSGNSDTHQVVIAAAAIAGVQQDKDFNVVKITSGHSTVSLLDYPAFYEHAFPELRRLWTVSLKRQSSHFRTYERSLNPPILHRKELLLPPTRPEREIFSALTAEAEDIGLFDDTTRIGFKRAWETLQSTFQ